MNDKDASAVNRRGLSIIAAGAVIIVLVLVLAISGIIKYSEPAPPTDYGFNSRYEINRAESLVTETILSREEKADGEPEGDVESPPEETLIKTAHCVPRAPGPTTTDLSCTVLVRKHVLYSTSGGRLNRWKATVTVNPRTGGLTPHVTKGNSEA